MPAFTKIARFLKGTRFADPPRSRLVIFDQEGSGRLIELALAGLGPVILPTRQEVFYCTPAILIRMLLNLRHVEELKFRQFYKIYLLSCLQQMDPDVVITMIDNSIYFQELSRSFVRARFFAIQNGMRSVASVARPSQHPTGWLSEDPKWGHTLHLPDFFCFGPAVAPLYGKFGHKVDRFHFVGSLLGDYYKVELSPKEGKLRYDLCLISEFRPSIMMGSDFPLVRRGLEPLHGFLKRYVEETSLRFAVATGLDDPAEGVYFKGLFGDRAAIIPREGSFSTYRAMEGSDVCIAFYSTAAFEAFGWGQKVLFCNLSGEPTLSCPIDGPWSLTGGDYAAFKEKLDNLRRMTRAEFTAQAREAAASLMVHDPARPAHRAVREAVVKALEAAAR